MKHKILIADDSLTIQKVIKITLASEPFELFECTDAQDLENNLNEIKPSIVLLDFNLSEDKTGYDLSREIKKLNSNAKILMLFGTFDTIDESLLEESGVNHKIVKPFDGTKFINLCRVMADELDVEGAQSISDTEADFNTEAFPEPILEEPEVIESESEIIEEDEWIVEGSQSFEEEEDEEVIQAEEENPLVENMKDWGMDVPSVIGGSGSNNEIPSVIASMPEAISEETVLPTGDDLAFPSDDDLAFPDMDAFSDGPQLRTIEISDEDEPVVGELEISEGGTDTDEALSALKAELEDELEDKVEPSEDLWGADIVEDLPVVESHQLEKVVDNTTHEIENSFDDDSFDEVHDMSGPEDFPSDVMDEEPTEPATQTFVAPAPVVKNDEELEAKLREKLTPVVEEFVKEYCRESVEKIAWEIIPDLAENLIKKEIQKISESIINP